MPEKLNLNDIVERIENNKLVLPNFQREYVWNEDETQKAFLASILAKIPLGNIITFNDKKDSFACKIVGRKDRLDEKDITTEYVDFLLDGQQRVTTLMLMFSNRLFKDKDGNDITAGQMVNSDIRKRFFLKLPNYKDSNLEREDDYFGFLNFSFKFKEIPCFCSYDLYDGGESSPYIEVKRFNRNDNQKWYHPKYDLDNHKTEFKECATQENLIPFFLLLDYNHSLIRDILVKIAEKRRDYLIDEYGSSGSKELKDLLKSLNIKQNSNIDNEKLRQIINDKISAWADDMKEYLRNCIRELKINEFIVDKENDKERAIDIYEALNKHGVSLTTFDLVVARAAKLSTGENLNDKLKDIIKDEHLNSRLLSFLSNNTKTYWNAEKAFKNIIDGNEINKMVLTQFLSLLCIVSNINIGDFENKLTPDYCKEKRILKLSPENIYNNSDDCMKSVVDALMYLQFKQGVYKLNCIHYNLTLLPISYVFYFCRKKGYSFSSQEQEKSDLIVNLLNAWYKIAIFTDFFEKEQNVRVIKYLTHFDSLLTSNKLPDYFDFRLDERLEMILNVTHYNDEDMLLYKNPEYKLSNAIEKYICQYYLSKQSACDIIKENGNLSKINAWSDDVSYQCHHFIPLRADKILKDKEQFKMLDNSERRNSGTLINSPLNKVLITQKSNSKIGDMRPAEYSDVIPDEFYSTNNFSKIDNLETDINKIVEEQFLERIYRNRLNSLKGDLKSDIRSSVDIVKNYIKNHSN